MVHMSAVIDEDTYWAEELRQWQTAAAQRPERLTPIPAERWPPHFHEVLLQAWESRAFLAQLYEAGQFNGLPCRRLSVCRYPVIKGGAWEGYIWEDVISWEELMEAKRQVGLGDAFALEIYPPDEDAVNLSNTRHLWLPAEALPIGWSQHRPTNGGKPTIGAST